MKLEGMNGTEKWNWRDEETVENRESEEERKGDDERERQREARTLETTEGREEAAIKTVREREGSKRWTGEGDGFQKGKKEKTNTITLNFIHITSFRLKREPANNISKTTNPRRESI